MSTKKEDKKNKEPIFPAQWAADEIAGDVQIISDEGAYTYSTDNMAIDEKDNYHDYRTDDKNKAKKQSRRSGIVDMSVENPKL